MLTVPSRDEEGHAQRAGPADRPSGCRVRGHRSRDGTGAREGDRGLPRRHRAGEADGHRRDGSLRCLLHGAPAPPGVHRDGPRGDLPRWRRAGFPSRGRASRLRESSRGLRLAAPDGEGHRDRPGAVLCPRPARREAGRPGHPGRGLRGRRPAGRAAGPGPRGPGRPVPELRAVGRQGDPPGPGHRGHLPPRPSGRDRSPGRHLRPARRPGVGGGGGPPPGGGLVRPGGGRGIRPVRCGHPE